MSYIIAIDGPAGVGKGTIAEYLANKFNLVNIDTGATYRCVTLAILRKGIPLEELDKILEVLNTTTIEFSKNGEEQIVYLNGEDVSKQIRTSEVNAWVSKVSAIKEVRLKMVDFQRKLAQNNNVVMEGRDIGTYVFPNADIKIYLDASAEERAKRRYRQNQEQGIQTPYEEVLQNIIQRDENDKKKEMGALKIAEDAVVIDTTNYTLEENIKRVEEIIAKGDKKGL